MVNVSRLDALIKWKLLNEGDPHIMTDEVEDLATESGADAKLAANGIQVISRAASILRALRDEPDGLSLGQIATRVELPRSTVQRIVRSTATADRVKGMHGYLYQVCRVRLEKRSTDSCPMSVSRC